MKYVSLILLLAGIAAAQIPSGYVSYWPMDGDLTDAAGSNHGTYSGAAAPFYAGTKGQALDLNGTASVNVGNDASLDFTGSFSIGGWVNLHVRKTYARIVGHTRGGFYIQQHGGWPLYWQFTFDGGEKTTDPQSVGSQFDRWIHFMAIYDGTDMYWYRDGVAVDTAASAGMTATTNDLKFGAMEGLLDEMIYYNRALSGSEMVQLMNATMDTTPPVISNITYENLPGYSAMISWDTDMIATGEIEYGIDTSYYSVLWTKLDTVHNLQINGLVDGDEYYYRIRSKNSLGYLSVSPWCTLAVPQPGPTERFSIDDGVDRSGKFIPSGRVWPVEVGDVDVCFWAHDKLAAFNVNIDDNALHERDWWIRMAKKHGFQPTWFIIIGRLYTNHSYFGNFNTWKVAIDSGMDVGSHSYHHGCTECVGEYYYGCDYEYSEPVSAALREWGIRPLVFAAPGQSAFTNSGTIRKKYYIGSRTGAGGSHPTVGKGASRSTIYDQARTAATDGRRSVSFQYFHQAAGNTLPQATQDSIFTVWDSLFGAIQQDFGDDLWWYGSTGIAQYTNSRETHTLEVTAVTDDHVSFVLKDSMIDVFYDFPLTVKVRIDNSWDTCIAMQGDKSVDVSVVEHNSDKYALVQAVPDRGEVVLSTDGQTTDIKALANPRLQSSGAGARTFEHSNGERTTLYRLSGEMVPAGMKPEKGMYLKYRDGQLWKIMVLE